MKICKRPGCEKKIKDRGVCERHHRRLLRDVIEAEKSLKRIVRRIPREEQEAFIRKVKRLWNEGE